MREWIEQLRFLVEDEADAEYVTPDEYHKIIGRCPPTWHIDPDGKKCHQVRPGPKKFRIGSFEPEIRDKLRAGKKAQAEPEPKKAGPKAAPAKKRRELPDNPITREETVPPAGKRKPYDIDPTRDKDKDGITDAARVGLCGTCTAPPAEIPRLPNLTPDEREVEERFASAFEADPDAFVDEYRDRQRRGLIGDAPNVFSTDDAKLLNPDYNPTGDDAAKKEAMGRYNAVVHQTANAIAKRAFLAHLDELEKLPPDDPKRSILVTNGGVASGKGYALGNVEETKAKPSTTSPTSLQPSSAAAPSASASGSNSSLLDELENLVGEGKKKEVPDLGADLEKNFAANWKDPKKHQDGKWAKAKTVKPSALLKPRKGAPPPLSADGSTKKR